MTLYDVKCTQSDIALAESINFNTLFSLNFSQILRYFIKLDRHMIVNLDYHTNRFGVCIIDIF